MEKFRDNAQTGYSRESMERKNYFNRLGYNEVEIGNMRNREETMHEKIILRDMDIEKQIINGKLREAKYCEIITEELPRYLKEDVVILKTSINIG